MAESIKDPYYCIDPRKIWSRRFTGSEGGLGLIDPMNKKVDIWSIVYEGLELIGVGKNLHGKRIVELGAGESTLFRDYVIENGASEYVGIDLYTASNSLEHVIGSTVVSSFSEDAHRFLSGQPSNSAIIAQFMLLDQVIFEGQCKHYGIDSSRIATALAREIYRVQQPGTHFISFGPEELFLEELERVGFVRERISTIFRKD